MRKQYYFRPSRMGLLVWDVDRLISALAHDPVPDHVGLGPEELPYWNLFQPLPG